MYNKNEILAKIWIKFIVMWLITGIGMVVGSVLPPMIALIGSLIGLLLLIIAMFLKDSIASYVYMVMPFFVGLGFYYSLTYYLESLGTGFVVGALLLTIIIFLTLGFIGYVMVKKDLYSWGIYLFFALLILIIISIVAMFFSSFIMEIIVAGAGILIFSLYTLYDFNQIRHRDISPDETARYALELYLDFINLFLDILRLMNALKGDD